MTIPLYADLADFIAFNGGPRHQARGVVVREFRPGWATYGDETDLEGLMTRLPAIAPDGTRYADDAVVLEERPLPWRVGMEGSVNG